MRRRAALVLVAIVFARGRAHAQLCHDLPPMSVASTEGAPEPSGTHVHAGHASHAHAGHAAHHRHGGLGYGLGLRLELATAALGDQPVSYQGVAAHVHAHVGPVVVAAHLPAYRLELPDRRVVGLGDLHLEAWVRVVRRAAVSAGVGLPIGLATGSRRDHLGMGHVMIMPAAFAAVRRGSLDAIAVAAYHYALDATGHVHDPRGPVVAPMASREVAGAVRASYWFAPGWAALVDAAIAVPTTSTPTRTAAGVGVRWQIGRIDASVSVQLGLTGDPFIARGVAELHVMP